MLLCWLFPKDGLRLKTVSFELYLGVPCWECFYLPVHELGLLCMQIREQGQQKGEASPYLAELLRLEEQAKQDGLGRWSKVCFSFPL